jgi:hypothetical protein
LAFAFALDSAQASSRAVGFRQLYSQRLMRPITADFCRLQSKIARQSTHILAGDGDAVMAALIE